MKHGHALKGKKTTLYRAWISMRSRCNNPKTPQWKDYGGRGIRVCKRWDSFENFAADMGPHPGKGLTLDRINNAKNYCKFNCQWATRIQQGRNTRRIKLTLPAASEIRQRYTSNHGQWSNGPALAQEFGVSLITIRKIAGGEIWR
jgi:hypothetical protein